MSSFILKILRASALIAAVRTAFAYLDPGSGSIIIQVLVALILGIVATVGIWRDRLLRLLGRKPGRTSETEKDESQNK